MSVYKNATQFLMTATMISVSFLVLPAGMVMDWEWLSPTPVSVALIEPAAPRLVSLSPLSLVDEVAEEAPGVLPKPAAHRTERLPTQVAAVAPSLEASASSQVRRKRAKIRPLFLSSRVAKRPTRTRKKRKCVEPVSAIRPIGKATYAVDRRFVNGYAKDMKKLESLARVYRHRGQDGRYDGFRLRGIRCGSPLAQSGFREGDILTHVNGKRVATIPQALLAYGKIRRKRWIRVEGIRRGRPFRLTYRLA